METQVLPTEFPQLSCSAKKPASNVQEGQSAMKCSDKLPDEMRNLPPLPPEGTCNSSSDEEVEKKKKRKKVKKKKKVVDREAMPPPSTPVEEVSIAKRPRSEEEVLSPKRRVSRNPDRDISDISDCETVLSADLGYKSPVDARYRSAQSGNESSTSVLSIRGKFDVAPQCSSLTSEQIRALLRKLYCKKNEHLIRKTILEYTDDPARLIPQIELLQARARGNKDYNEAARLERVLKKVEGAVLYRTSESTSPQCVTWRGNCGWLFDPCIRSTGKNIYTRLLSSVFKGC